MAEEQPRMEWIDLGNGKQILRTKAFEKRVIRRTAFRRPLKSRSLSVHPEEADKFNQDAKDAGISGVHYDSGGVLWFESERGRNQELARRGYGDGDACYRQRPPGG